MRSLSTISNLRKFLLNTGDSARSLFIILKQRLTTGSRRLFYFVNKKPKTSFYILLALIFISILISNILTKPKTKENETLQPAKPVSVYSIGSVPTVTFQGQIDKSGVIPIVALTPGIIQNIYVTEGQTIARGTWITYLSTNYQGGNAAVLSRQIAEAQYKNILDTFDTQKDLINKQRDLANKNADSADQLRNIASQAINDTQNLVNLDQDIVNSLANNIATLEANNVNGVNDAMIVSTKQIEAQVQAGLNQTQSALKTSQFQTDSSKSAAQIPDQARDITLKQLDLQEKALNLSRDTSRLQLQIAQVMEAMMYPSAPFAGTIQKVFVKVGQNVNPGTPLAVISSEGRQTVKVTVYAPWEITSRISRLEDSLIHIGNTTLHAKPLYVSKDAVQGILYAITYVLPDNYASQLTDKSYIAVDIPVGYPQTISADPFVPIDAIYQTPDKAYLYVVKDGKVESREVTLGTIFGRYVEVTTGLSDKDIVILNRTVISGDKVEISK